MVEVRVQVVTMQMQPWTRRRNWPQWAGPRSAILTFLRQHTITMRRIQESCQSPRTRCSSSSTTRTRSSRLSHYQRLETPADGLVRWYKVKIKPKSQDEESPVGLVPASYVEPVRHTAHTPESALTTGPRRTQFGSPKLSMAMRRPPMTNSQLQRTRRSSSTTRKRTGPSSSHKRARQLALSRLRTLAR